MRYLVNLDSYKALLSRYRYWVMGAVVVSPLVVLAAGFYLNPSYVATQSVIWRDTQPQLALNKFWVEAERQVRPDKISLALPAIRKDSQVHYKQHYSGRLMTATQLTLSHSAHRQQMEVQFSDPDSERAKAMAKAVGEQVIQYVTQAEQYQQQKALGTLESHIRLSRQNVAAIDAKLRQSPLPVAMPESSESLPAPPNPVTAPTWDQVLAYLTHYTTRQQLKEMEQPLVSELKFKRPQEALLWAYALADPQIAKAVETYRREQARLAGYEVHAPEDNNAVSQSETRITQHEQTLNGLLSKRWPMTHAADRQQMIEQLGGLTERNMAMLNVLSLLHTRLSATEQALASLPQPPFPLDFAETPEHAATVMAPGEGRAGPALASLLKQRHKVLGEQVFYEEHHRLLKHYLAHRSTHVTLGPPATLIPSTSQLVTLALAMLSMPFSGVLMLVFVGFWSQRPVVPTLDVGALLNLPMLQQIPVDKMLQQRAKQKRKGAMVGLMSSNGQLVKDTPLSDALPALMQLAGQVQELVSLSGNRVMTVISPRPGSGTTFLITNLATLLAERGRKVLVIDGNLKHPEVHEVFDIPEMPGLIELLDGRANIKQVLRHVERFGPLLVMPVGKIPTDPVQMLIHPQMDSVMASLQKYFDVILINAPSDIQAPETIAVARLAGQVILNFKASDANPRAIQKWQRIFDELPATKLGVVVNLKP